MIFQIHLIDHCQKHCYHFVEAVNKEHALNALVFQKGINLLNFNLVLVIDLSKQILKADPEITNILNVKIGESGDSLDHLLDYNPFIFKDILKISNLKFTRYDCYRHGFLKLKDLLKPNENA